MSYIASAYYYYKRLMKSDPTLALEFQAARILDEAEEVLKRAVAEGGSSTTKGSPPARAATPRRVTKRDAEQLLEDYGDAVQRRVPSLTREQARARVLDTPEGNRVQKLIVGQMREEAAEPAPPPSPDLTDEQLAEVLRLTKAIVAPHTDASERMRLVKRLGTFYAR